MFFEAMQKLGFRHDASSWCDFSMRECLNKATEGTITLCHVKIAILIKVARTSECD